jgi:hypothetical protein
MQDTANIKEHMAVVDSTGAPVGKVDKVESLSIKLTKDSPNSRGEHRYIPVAWVASVDKTVRLDKLAAVVQEQWQAHPVQDGEYPEETT